MSSAKILVRERAPAHALPPTPDFAWYLLGWIGAVFALVGWVDILLTWYPPAFGNAEWEFGTITPSLNNLPLPALGLMLVLAAAVARGQRRLIRVMAVILIVVALVLLLVAVLYALSVPLALGSQTNPVILTGLKKAVAKTATQLLLYPIGFAWIGIQAWRHTRQA